MAFDAREANSFHAQITGAALLPRQLAFSFGAKRMDDVGSNGRALGDAFSTAAASYSDQKRADDRQRGCCPGKPAKRGGWSLRLADTQNRALISARFVRLRDHPPLF